MTRWVMLGFALVAILLNLPALVSGTVLITQWIRIYMFGTAYFQYPYALVGAVCVSLSIAGIAASGTAIIKRGRYTMLTFVSLILGLTSAIAFPGVAPQGRMGVASLKLLGHADQGLDAWEKKHGRYPTGEDELHEAIGGRPLSEQAIFLRRGRPISYSIRMTIANRTPTNASAPGSPGTVNYYVVPDGKEYWLTFATLKNPVSEAVVLYHLPGHEEAFVMTRKHQLPGEGTKAYIE